MRLEKMSKFTTWKFASIVMKKSTQYQVWPATQPIVMVSQVEQILIQT